MEGQISLFTYYDKGIHKFQNPYFGMNPFDLRHQFPKYEDVKNLVWFYQNNFN